MNYCGNNIISYDKGNFGSLIVNGISVKTSRGIGRCLILIFNLLTYW